MRRTGIMTTVAAAALALAACGSGGGGGTAAPGDSSSSGGSSTAASTDLASWQSPLGEIVVDGQGRAVYVFDKDTPDAAASACTGQCASMWPAVTTASSAPSVSGVTGEVGTAPGPDGSQQVTLDGHRLYTFSGDSGDGQVNGQGFMDVWWVVAPDGTKVTAAASSSVPPPPGY